MPSVFKWRSEAPKRKSPKKRSFIESTNAAAEIRCSDKDSSDTDDAPETDALMKIQRLEEEVEGYKQKLRLERFGLNRFSYDDEKINFYTGFPTYKSFLKFSEAMEPTASNMQSAYYQPSETLSLKGRPITMMLVDELFMTLCRIRLNLLEEDLSDRFLVSLSTVSRKIITWVNYLYFVLGKIPIWLDRDVVQRVMPRCFQEEYPNTRVIIDCT